MSDRQGLVENEELPEDVLTNHGQKPNHKSLYVAVCATYFAPISIGLCLGPGFQMVFV